MVKDALPSALLNDALYMLLCDVTLKWSQVWNNVKWDGSLHHNKCSGKPQEIVIFSSLIDPIISKIRR